MDDATTSLLILGVVTALFIWNTLPVGLVAVLAALALFLTGLVDLPTAVGGFGDPVVIFIAALFVVGEGIDSTGVTTWAGQAVLRLTEGNKGRVLVAVMVLSALLTALITPNGSVAALLPMVVVVAVRLGVSPAQMLIPLAFAAHAGSLLALTGSPVNVIINGAIRSEGGDPFGFFEFALIGVPLLLVTVLMVVTLAPLLLPAGAERAPAPDFSRYAATMVERYGLHTHLVRFEVPADSSVVGTAPRDLDLPGVDGARLTGVQTGRSAPLELSRPLAEGDTLVFEGPLEVVRRVGARHGLRETYHASRDEVPRMLGKHQGLAEVVVPPGSTLVGESVFAGMLRPTGLVMLALRRQGRDADPTGTVVAEGDAVLFQGDWTAIDDLVDNRRVLMVDEPGLVRRQAVPMGRRAPVAVGVLVAMIAVLTLGLVPPAIAGLAAAAAMVLFRVVDAEQALRSVSWQTVVLIGGLIPMSAAIQSSGAADLVAGSIIGAVGVDNPYLLLAVLFALTAVFSQVISNAATTLIVIPIAVASASETGLAVEPVLMLVCVAAAAAFLTPIATPANTMVMNPGGYGFGDYWRLGLPIQLVWLVVALLLVPRIWPL
jgi:di/tricarboxylate transporter